MSDGHHRESPLSPARVNEPLPAFRRETLPHDAPADGGRRFPTSTYEALEELFQPRGPSLKDFITLLKKRRRSIVFTAFVMFSLGTLYALLSPSQYTATATLEIRGYSPVLGHAEVETLLENDTRKLLYQATTTNKLTNLGLADEVLQTDRLGDDIKQYFKDRRSSLNVWIEAVLKTLFGSEPAGPADPKFHYPETFMNQYYKLIQISPIHDTSLVEVRATTTDKALSQRIANAHAEGLIRLLLGEQRDELGTHLKALKTHADDLQQKLATAEADVARFAREHQLVTLSDNSQGNLMFSQLADLNKLLAAAQAKRVESESKMTRVEEQKKQENSLLDDETVRDLRTKLKDAESDYASLSRLVTGEYPKLLELRGKIESLRKTVQEERSENLSALRTQYESDLAAEKLLVSQFEDQLRKSHEMSAQLVQFNLLQREASSLRDLTQSVLKSLNETEISTSSSMSNVFVSDYAALPRLPAAPRRGLIIVLSLMLGIMFGTALAVVRELVDSTIKVSDEAQAALGLPTLGIIPSFKAVGATNLIERRSMRNIISAWLPLLSSRLRLPWRPAEAPPSASETADDRALIVDPHAASALHGTEQEKHDGTEVGTSADNVAERHITPANDHHPAEDGEAPLSTAVIDATNGAVPLPEAGVLDALRTLRANIVFSSTENASRVIMVASAREREGKTSVITNLAITYAKASQRTLLIDADLRRPKIDRRFSIPNDHAGLVDYLAGQATLEDIISYTPVANLTIIPAGSPTVDPTELLDSDRMRQLVGALRDCFDVILIDTAPVLPVADSLILAQYSETVVFVVRSGRTEKTAAQEAVRRLRRVGARVRGLVLNDFDPGAGKYSDDRYSVSKYKYSAPERRQQAKANSEDRSHGKGEPKASVG